MFRHVVIFICATVCVGARESFLTTAERTNYQRTGRYDEAVSLVEALAKKYSRARKLEFGITPEGRLMVALILSGEKAFRPELAHRKSLPVVLFQGGIHAGEIDGKDAGFEVVREILEGKTLPGILDSVVIIFVPVFNVDGHERFGPNQRPNQNGPAEMGWRTTAQNLNLNRDYLKADSPEMRAMLRFMHVWDPILYIDLHTTDGAKFQHDIAVMIQPANEPRHPLAETGRQIRDKVMSDLTGRGHLPLSFYPSFRNENDPKSGSDTGIAPPRFSQGYWSVRNRFGVLVETHSWKDYRTRVVATKHALESMLKQALEQGTAWMKLARDADAQARNGISGPLDLAFKATEPATMFNFKGYAYERSHSGISGQPWIHYDTSREEIWELPLLTNVIATASATPPRGGYIIPAGWVPVVEPRLIAHGVAYHKIERHAKLPVEVFRATATEFGRVPFEGRQRLSAKGSWQSETREVPAGSLFLPVKQRLALLLIHLFEPDAPDSLVSWGVFNAAFEQKEYMEPYVTEQVARDMLATNAPLKAEFERLLEQPTFVTNAAKRLEFFYRRHAAWDERFNLYPVYRIDTDTVQPDR